MDLHKISKQTAEEQKTTYIGFIDSLMNKRIDFSEIPTHSISHCTHREHITRSMYITDLIHIYDVLISVFNIKDESRKHKEAIVAHKKYDMVFMIDGLRLSKKYKGEKGSTAKMLKIVNNLHILSHSLCDRCIYITMSWFLYETLDLCEYEQDFLTKHLNLDEFDEKITESFYILYEEYKKNKSLHLCRLAVLLIRSGSDAYEDIVNTYYVNFRSIFNDKTQLYKVLIRPVDGLDHHHFMKTYFIHTSDEVTPEDIAVHNIYLHIGSKIIEPDCFWSDFAKHFICNPNELNVDMLYAILFKPGLTIYQENYIKTIVRCCIKYNIDKAYKCLE